MTYGRIIQLESITKYQMSKQSIGHPPLFFLEGKLQSHYYKSIDYFLQHNWITRSQKEMGNRITLTQVNYVRKADETSSVAIMSQTPCFDPKWPWLFHQIRWKHYDIAPESASSSPSPIIHGSSFCTWKPTRALLPSGWQVEREGRFGVLPVIMNSCWALELGRSDMRVDADNRAQAITSRTSGAQTPQIWPRDNWARSVRGRDGITPPDWVSPSH